MKNVFVHAFAVHTQDFVNCHEAEPGCAGRGPMGVHISSSSNCWWAFWLPWAFPRPSCDSNATSCLLVLQGQNLTPDAWSRPLPITCRGVNLSRYIYFRYFLRYFSTGGVCVGQQESAAPWSRGPLLNSCCITRWACCDNSLAECRQCHQDLLLALPQPAAGFRHQGAGQT